MIPGLIAISSAQAYEAYECNLHPDPACGCILNDDRPEYRLVVLDFPASYVTEIEGAAGAWSAGPASILRGADFQHIRGLDRLTGTTNNGISEVWDEPSAWFTARFLPATTIALTLQWLQVFPNCDVVESDIVFNESTVFSTSLPNNLPTYVTSTDAVSIGQAAVHEFGHIIGFGHESDVLAVMHNFYPAAGGDLSAAKYRVHEDDFAGLLDWYPCLLVGCDGVNVMISKFEPGAIAGTAIEVWTDDNSAGETWEGIPGAQIVGANRPANVYASITGTNSLANVEVRWVLSNDTDLPCWDGIGTDYLVGEKTIGLNVNAAFPTNLGAWIVPNAPPGDYRVCVRIDPDGDISETSEIDNNVRSDRLFKVL